MTRGPASETAHYGRALAPPFTLHTARSPIAPSHFNFNALLRSACIAAR